MPVSQVSSNPVDIHNDDLITTLDQQLKDRERAQRAIRDALSSAAEELLNRNLSFIPLTYNKVPCLKEWKPYQHRVPTQADVDAWLDIPELKGWGLVCGTVNGGLEVLDCDNADTAMAFIRQLKAEDVALAYKLMRSVVQTPRPGMHFMYRYASVGPGMKLAKDGDAKCLIETRGDGNYVVSVYSHPSIHETGRPYTFFKGSYDNIPRLTEDEVNTVHEHAIRFNKYVPPIARDTVQTVARATAGTSDGDRPGDAFNERASWETILFPHGWRIWRNSGGVTYWTRPGKAFGLSATTGHCGDRLYVFSTSTRFESSQTYNKFGAYALLNHNGDYFAAAQELLAKGYGSPKPSAEAVNREIKTAVCKEVDIDAPDDNALITAAQSRLIAFDPKLFTPVHWIWYGRIVRAGTNVVAGDVDLGKSLILLDCAARISTGRPFPSGEVTTGKVLILSAEDNPWNTIGPRLVAAEADLSKVRMLDIDNLSADLALVESILKSDPEYAMLIVDPIKAYVPDAFKENAPAVRRFLKPIEALAQAYNIAVVFMHHYRKAPGSAKDRIAGDGAWIQAARCAISANADKEDQHLRHFCKNKSNLADEVPSIEYRIQPVPVTVYDQGQPVQANIPRIVWGATTAYVADDFSGVDSERNKVHIAKELIEDMLSDGRQQSSDTIAEALKAEGISKSTLFRARKLISGLKITPASFQGKWWWSIPQSAGSDNA